MVPVNDEFERQEVAVYPELLPDPGKIIPWSKSFFFPRPVSVIQYPRHGSQFNCCLDVQAVSQVHQPAPFHPV